MFNASFILKQVFSEEAGFPGDIKKDITYNQLN